MRNAVIGLIIGIVAGIVLGTTVIAPRLAEQAPESIRRALAPKPDNEGAENGAGDTAGASATDAPDKAGADSTPTKNVRRLGMASAYPGNLPALGEAAKRLERTVWRISNGMLDLRFNPPGALAGADETLDAVISGAIDAYFTPMDQLVERDPSLTLFAGPPFGTSVQAYLGWMDDAGGRRLFDEAMAGMNLKGLPCGMVPDSGGGWFRKPLTTKDDFVGLRLRADGISARLYARLGADVISMPLADALGALETGGIEAAQLSAPHIDRALGIAGDGLTYYLPGWSTPASVMALLMPAKVWDSLGTVAQTQIETACGDNIGYALGRAETLQFKALKAILAAGADVRPWPAEIRDAMHEAWQAEAAERQKESQMFSKALKSYRQFIKGQSIWEELAR